MTPEVKFIEEYNEWLEAFLAAGKLDDEESFKAGLLPYITEESVLTEPASLPWGGRLVGFDGWVYFIRQSRPILRHFVGRFEILGTDYYQCGDIGLREFTVRMDPKDGIGDPYILKLLERYAIKNGKISELFEYYSDTAGFLDLLAKEEILPV